LPGTSQGPRQEPLNSSSCPAWVHHLGVELDAVETPKPVSLERSDPHLGGGRSDCEPLGCAHDRIRVAHHTRSTGPSGPSAPNLPVPAAESGRTRRCRSGPPHAEQPGEELGTVADAEHRHARREQTDVDRGGRWRVDGLRATREDHTLGSAGEHLARGHRSGHDLGVDVRFAHTPCDELGVLGPEVDHEDRVVVGPPSPDATSGAKRAPAPAQQAPGRSSRSAPGQLHMPPTGPLKLLALVCSAGPP